MRLRRRGHLKQGSRAGARRPHVHVKRQGLDAEREPTFGQLLDNASAVYVHVRNTAAALRVPSQCRHTLAQILRVGKMEAISAAIARDNRGRAEKQLAVPLRRRGKERFEPSFSGYITTTDRDDQEDRASE